MTFRKILIANRGEIAVRIARTCWDMGIKPVGVYSDADKTALHVRACSEAYRLGPPPASESYLRGDVIIDVARKAGCEAIHPGYGFLSENAEFARSVVQSGLVWIGPPAEAIELMGSKIESKRLAEKLGVPIVPGYFGDDQDEQRLASAAERVGYPVLVKASAGGGGKGMRIVVSASDMTASVAAARREALAAFGDDSLLLEKYLANPRHIEVQVLADNHGNIIHLGERECSIQRRHQKVVEESPSPAITNGSRDAMTSAALKLAKAAGYTNAGTVEFVVEDGKFYFLEMNTRLQVEHPVTEEATAIDLVMAQIQIAAGERLWISQENIRFEAHAFEARLYAEDPEHDFVPSTGTITAFEMVEDARVDTGVTVGDTISPHYDPMIAKIITSGPSRESALTNMREVLSGMKVEGPKTNLDFLRWLFAHPQFELGNLSTRFIEQYYRPGAFPLVPQHAVLAATALLTLFSNTLFDDTSAAGAWGSGPWRQARLNMRTEMEIDGRLYHAVCSAAGGNAGSWQVCIKQGEDSLFDGTARFAIGDPDAAGGIEGEAPTPVLLLQVGDETVTHAVGYDVDWQSELFSVAWDGRRYWVRQAPPISTETLGTSIHLSNEDSLVSQMPGKILKVFVKSGDAVAEEQPLVIIEAMKMEFTVKAPHEGKVSKVHYDEGAQVAVGDILIELEKGG